jgi:hypothetical protein
MGEIVGHMPLVSQILRLINWALALEIPIAEDKHIHSRPKEAIQGVVRPADHRLVLVERRVQ